MIKRKIELFKRKSNVEQLEQKANLKNSKNSFKQKIVLVGSLSTLAIAIICIGSITLITSKIGTINNADNSSKKTNSKQTVVLDNLNNSTELKEKPSKDSSYFQSISKYLNMTNSSNEKIFGNIKSDTNSTTTSGTTNATNEINNNESTSTTMAAATASIGTTTSNNTKDTTTSSSNASTSNTSDTSSSTNDTIDPNKKNAIYTQNTTTTSSAATTNTTTSSNTSGSTTTSSTTDSTTTTSTTPTISKKSGKEILAYIKKLKKAATTLTSYGKGDQIDISTDEYKTFRLALRNNNINTDSATIYSLDETAYADYVDDNFKLSDFAVITNSNAGEIFYLGDNAEGYIENGVHFYNKDIYYDENQD